MKIGIGTNIWGIRIDDPKSVFGYIAKLGFEGIEISQRPDLIGVSDIHDLCRLLRENNLELLSLNGGSINERINFLGEKKPKYMYFTDRDFEYYEKLTGLGFRPSIHPGRFSSIHSIADVDMCLKRYPKITLLIDVAHWTIAGEDLSTVIRKYKGNISAIHLKDWIPEFGRFGHRYGRGFVDLGKGTVDFKRIFQALDEIKYDQWIILEIDRIPLNINKSIRQNLSWLKSMGMTQLRIIEQEDDIKERKIYAFPRDNQKCNTVLEARFREAMMFAAREEPDEYFSNLIAALNDLIPCKLISIWTVSPTQHKLARVASSNESYYHDSTEKALDPEELLCSIALERQAPVTTFDLTSEFPGKPYGRPDRKFKYNDLIEFGLRKMITVPIYNSWNYNYIRLLVNLYPIDDAQNITDDELYWLGREISSSSDIRLDRICNSATIRVDQIAGKSSGKKDFLKMLVGLIIEKVCCSGVAIFLVNEYADKLMLEASSGTRWFVPSEHQYYQKGEGITGYVWEKKEPHLSRNSKKETGHLGKSEEEVVVLPNEHVCIWSPMLDTKGEVIGVIRCRNKDISLLPNMPNMFDEDDVAILEAISQSAVPHLTVMLGDERRAKMLARLTHELKVPAVAIRGAAELILDTKGVKGFFDYDYPGDIFSWSELMRRLLNNAEFLQTRWESISIQPRLTLLMADVIAPAVRQVNLLLSERNFSLNGIVYHHFDIVPKLWIDQNHFQQVLFNLLSNAIKYGYKDPLAFQIEIVAEKNTGFYLIHFRDWGPGIPENYVERIFDEGFRSREAINSDVAGQGLGLWVVRKIIEAHGGAIHVTKHKLPTQFTIFLPDWLANHPPRKSSK